MKDFMALFTLSVFIEGITDYVKLILGKKICAKIPSELISVVIGTAVCLLCGADIFVIFGFDESFGVLGTVLTGILLSRGSNYLHSLLNKLGEQNQC